MNFEAFVTALEQLALQIEATWPSASKVAAFHWGAPPEALPDLPCVIAAWAEPERHVGFGLKEELPRVHLQLAAARATVGDRHSSLLATSLWQAAKGVFDGDMKIGGTVQWAQLRGSDPTVPVLLQHGGQAYIGWSGVLEVRTIEEF